MRPFETGKAGALFGAPAFIKPSRIQHIMPIGSALRPAGLGISPPPLAPSVGRTSGPTACSLLPAAALGDSSADEPRFSPLPREAGGTPALVDCATARPLSRSRCGADYVALNGRPNPPAHLCAPPSRRPGPALRNRHLTDGRRTAGILGHGIPTAGRRSFRSRSAMSHPQPRWGLGGVSQFYKRRGCGRHPGQVQASPLPVRAGLRGPL